MSRGAFCFKNIFSSCRKTGLLLSFWLYEKVSLESLPGVEVILTPKSIGLVCAAAHLQPTWVDRTAPIVSRHPHSAAARCVRHCVRLCNPALSTWRGRRSRVGGAWAGIKCQQGFFVPFQFHILSDNQTNLMRSWMSLLCLAWLELPRTG